MIILEHFVIAGHGYIGAVHRDVSPMDAQFLVRHLPKETDDIFYTDIDAALDTDPQFFDICTPNISHMPLCLAAVERNIPIYCEKPLANDLKSAEKMLAAVSEKGLYNGVAFNYRFLPCVAMLKKLLESGELGKIIYYNASFLHDSYILPRPAIWRTNKQAGGGALADLGIHLFDLCRYIFGESTLTHCEKHIEFSERTEVDEYARVTLQSEKARGYLEISRISAGKASQNGIEVFTHKGSITLRFDKPYELEIYDIEQKQTHIQTADKELTDTLCFPDQKHNIGAFYGSHKAALTTFINGLKRGQKSNVLADFADAVAAQKILDAALKY